MKTGPRDTRNTSFALICQHCYLSYCVYDSRLQMYCPEYAGRKRGVAPEIILELTKQTGVNRRWSFLEGVRNATVDVTRTKRD